MCQSRPSMNNEHFGNIWNKTLTFSWIKKPIRGRFCEIKGADIIDYLPTNILFIYACILFKIPFSWDDRRLKEKFRQAGQIEEAEIRMREGKSRGCGTIRFAYQDQAIKAVG